MMCYHHCKQLLRVQIMPKLVMVMHNLTTVMYRLTTVMCNLITIRLIWCGM